MITAPDFSEQIHVWLSSLDFQCALNQSENETFSNLQVSKNGHLVLELKLVDIKAWDIGKAVIELNLYKIRQSELRKNGVHSVTLWEDLWTKKEDIVKSRISSLLGISQTIPARLTKVTRIDKVTSINFLKNNHLQGSVSSKYQFGLYLPKQYFRILPADFHLDITSDNLLVAVATFSRPRIFPRADKPFRSYELIRFSNLLDMTVVGGINKLLSAFCKEVNPDDIMTYVDLEWSDGKGYNKLGFEEISEKPPIIFMLDTQSNERFSLRNSNEDDHLIEIFNAGSLKFVKTIEKQSSGS